MQDIMKEKATETTEKEMKMCTRNVDLKEGANGNEIGLLQVGEWLDKMSSGA